MKGCVKRENLRPSYLQIAHLTRANKLKDSPREAADERVVALFSEAPVGWFECLRRLVVVDGLSDAANDLSTDGLSSLRGVVWKVLLGVQKSGTDKLDTERYDRLVRRGEHPDFGVKIRNDTFRTFPKDESFKRRVPEASLIRVLNAFVYARNAEGFSYVQGMNVLLAPLLYVMPEPDAFYTFEVLLTSCLPSYVQRKMEGVRTGCALIEETLQVIDPELSDALKRAGAMSLVFAFSPLATLSASVPPLSSVLPLWDFFFALGAHLNVLVQCAQLLLRRDELLSSDASSETRQMLSGRRFFELDARALLGVALPLLHALPPEMRVRLERHTMLNHAL